MAGKVALGPLPEVVPGVLHPRGAPTVLMQQFVCAEAGGWKELCHVAINQVAVPWLVH